MISLPRDETVTTALAGALLQGTVVQLANDVQRHAVQAETEPLRTLRPETEIMFHRLALVT